MANFQYTYKEDGTVDTMYFSFGRDKVGSLNFYITEWSAYPYLHLRNKLNGKKISLGLDEYRELVTLQGEIKKAEKFLMKENRASDNEEEGGDTDKAEEEEDDDDDDICKEKKEQEKGKQIHRGDKSQEKQKSSEGEETVDGPFVQRLTKIIKSKLDRKKVSFPPKKRKSETIIVSSSEEEEDEEEMSNEVNEDEEEEVTKKKKKKTTKKSKK